MPHLPGHNRPFTSFLTQGMRNTNRNIGNFNNPGGGGFQNQYKTPPIFNPPFKPEEIPSFDFTQMGPPRRKYPWSPPVEPKGKFWPELGYPKPPTSVDFTELTKGSLIQGDVAGFGGSGITPGPGGSNDPGQSPMPTDELPQGWTWQFINGEWIPQGFGASDITPGPGGGDFFTGAGNVVDAPNLPGYQEGVGGALGGGDWLAKTDPMGAGFDVNNDGVVNAQDAVAYTSSPQYQQYAQGEDEFYNQLYSEQGYMQQVDNPDTTSFAEYIYNMSQNWDHNVQGGGYGQGVPEIIGDLQSMENVTQWLAGFDEGSPEASILQPLQYDWNEQFGQAFEAQDEFIQNPQSAFDWCTSQGFNPQEAWDTYSSTNQGFLDNLMNYIAPQQLAPQQFAGGGGQGGQAAKQLYYPGTSGGFAGVGSGIGGGKSLQELLGGM